MALKQVGARTEGDVYQGLFFWRQAASLFIQGSKVRRVDIEHDDASGVDDVAVFYEEPGIDAGGWLSMADFYQLKYHVDRRDSYSADALIDPTFINAQSSLLQRFHTAYNRISTNLSRFRMHLASNWHWKDDDPLASVLREYDGQLPDKFFTSGSRSQLGKICETWRTHLSLDKDDFEVFGKTLRLQLDHFGRYHFREWVYDHLARAGLQPPSDTLASSPYESLVQHFLMNGPNSFDAPTLRDLCVHEGLFALDDSTAARSIPTIGLRSFMRFAERLEDEVDEFVCVVNHFEGRQALTSSSWCESADKVIEFFGDTQRRAHLRTNEHALLLECHGSFAVLAGYELSNNSGCVSFPLQKPQCMLWKPSSQVCAGDLSEWVSTITELDADCQDIAVALCVTHDIYDEVSLYLDMFDSPRVGVLICMRPVTSIGPTSIEGADHASRLAMDFVAAMRLTRPRPTVRIHLFASAPNSLLFFIGKYREALGRITLYEYDFGLESHCTYEPSITLPINK